MDEIEIPQYFICPISLQIMKDPVTAVTGITYDRESIERWLKTPAAAAAAAVCPVTKQPLPRAASDLTPNHMLRRLIQAWCVVNADSGVDRIPTPKSPVRRSLILKLVRDVSRINSVSLNGVALKKLEEIADEGEKNQKSMAEAGVAKAMVSFIVRCFKDVRNVGIDTALRILHLTWGPTSSEAKKMVGENIDFVESLIWVLTIDAENTGLNTQALSVLKNVIEVANYSLIEGLNTEFFEKMVEFLRKNISPAATRAAIQILTETCKLGRSKTKIVEAGAVFELVEMELRNPPEKRTTELVFCLLAHLCSFADGRQQLLRHAGGVAVVAKRLLRVSAATDDLALCVLESIARYSGTAAVVTEMMRVGGVSKMCMVLQTDCAGYLKKKASGILRLHSNAWSNSPCLQVYLLTRCPR
ncbi:hypothetical protein ABFX02_04G214000 [Erythranthe guttata]